METDYLSNLPFELKEMIFSYLSVGNFVKFLRVSKRLKFEVEKHMPFKSLYLANFYTPFSGPDLIQVEVEDDLFKILKSPLFIRVKKLCLSLDNLRQDNYSNRSIRGHKRVGELFSYFLNRFQNLEELIIEKDFPVKSIALSLDLKNLKKFVAKASCIGILDTPELSYFSCENLENYDLMHPEKLKILKFSSFHNLLSLEKFINLETIEITRTAFLAETIKKFLNPFKMPNFNIPKLQVNFINFYDYHFETAASAFESLNLKELDKIIFYVNGLELNVYKNNIKRINEMKKNGECEGTIFLRLLIENLSKTADEIYRLKINVCELIKHNVSEEDLKTLRRKFKKNSSTFSIKGQIKEDEVDMLTNHLKIIRPDCLIICSLLNNLMKKSLIDQLYVFFIVIQPVVETKIEEEFSFLLKMKSLREIFVCSSEISIDFVIKAFSDLNSLNTFSLTGLKFLKCLPVEASRYLKIQECCTAEFQLSFFQDPKLKYRKKYTPKEIPKIKDLIRKLINVEQDRIVYVTREVNNKSIFRFLKKH